MESHENIFQRLFMAVRDFIVSIWIKIKPGSFAVKGAAKGILVATGLVYLAFIITQAAGPTIPMVVTLAALTLAGLLLIWLGQGVAWFIGLLARIPWVYRWAFAAGLALLFIALLNAPPSGQLTFIPGLLLAASAVGAGVASLVRPGWSYLTRIQKSVAVAGLALGIAALAGGLAWYGWAGRPAEAIPNAAKISGAPVARVALPDPSLPGPYPVKTLTYGSGQDKYRPEFDDEEALKTMPVDGSKLLEKTWSGITGNLRRLWWGFGPDALPINGRVWYPDGPGPFPLVLIVHGNHLMSDFSDPGYDYLGKLMASRGFIFVSVDENFLNSGVMDPFTGFTGENDARGWLLLEHLRVWQAWNDDPDNPFSGRVDMSRIAVTGHSRGGEAAAVAALFNRLPYYPDNAAEDFDYNFNIRAVAAIAPIDGQYNPSWKKTVLTGVNYFVLQGSHDADLTSFDGMNLWERMRIDDGEDLFKSALYIYRANHGQFNTTWGDNDRGYIARGFINRAALLSKADQEHIAKVYLSAFLEATLHDQAGYLPLFADARSAGEGWLPDTIYINRLETSKDRMAATFEEDVDLGTTTLPGGATRGMNFEKWWEQKIKTKWEGQDNAGVHLAWNEDATAEYRISLPEVGFQATGSDALIFSLADALEDPQPGKDALKDEEGAPRQPFDLTIAVEDIGGAQASLPLSRYMLLQPQIRAEVFKTLFGRDSSSEPVLQSYAIPLVDFREANPNLDLDNIRTIRFVFDRTPRGSVILDGIGFRPNG